jgi:hypothetical protein
MTNKPNSRLVNDRHHDTTDDHGNKIPNISVNLQTNSTKDISTKSQERYIKTDTKLVSLQREMRLILNEIQFYRYRSLTVAAVKK